MFTFIHNFRIAMQHPIPKIVLRLFALLALVWLFAAPLAGPGAAQAPRWSDPVSMGPGWFPDITADQAGNVHLAWSASVAKPNPDDPTGRSVIGYDQVMYAVESGGQWSKPIDIVALKMNGGSEVTRPTLLADPQGILHMTYRGVFVYYSNAPVSMAGLATNWAPPYRFSEDQVSYFSRMAMDSKGTLHLVYTENVMTAACTLCYHVDRWRCDLEPAPGHLRLAHWRCQTPDSCRPSRQPPRRLGSRRGRRIRPVERSDNRLLHLLAR
jgi:hypothetical protein